jgi:two-component system chemotaxis response regulator CheY
MSPFATIPLLVVDDEFVALDLCARLLKRIGFANIDVITTGFTALTMMRHKRYRAVISDWNMPEMSGIEFVRAIREDDHLRRTPFVMTSVDGTCERVRLAQVSGVDAFLVKPFDAQVLQAQLSEVLGLPRA